MCSDHDDDGDENDDDDFDDTGPHVCNLLEPDSNQTRVVTKMMI